MTKTQVRKRREEILSKAEDLISDLYELQEEAEDTRDSIEPYEGCNDLTAEQEERQEWFEYTCDSIQEAIDSLESAQSSLEEID